MRLCLGRNELGRYFLNQQRFGRTRIARRICKYLEWALQLTQSGSIIIADNCIRAGLALREKADHDADMARLIEYNKRVSSNPRLVSVALAMDENYTNGFTIAVVQPGAESD